MTLVISPTTTALAAINLFRYVMTPTIIASASYATTSVATILASYATTSVATILASYATISIAMITTDT